MYCGYVLLFVHYFYLFVIILLFDLALSLSVFFLLFPHSFLCIIRSCTFVGFFLLATLTWICVCVFSLQIRNSDFIIKTCVFCATYSRNTYDMHLVMSQTSSHTHMTRKQKIRAAEKKAWNAWQRLFCIELIDYIKWTLFSMAIRMHGKKYTIFVSLLCWINLAFLYRLPRHSEFKHI